MQIVITYQEVRERCDLVRFRKIVGLEDYPPEDDTTYTLSLVEAVSCGVLSSSQLKIIENNLK